MGRPQLFLGMEVGSVIAQGHQTSCPGKRGPEARRGCGMSVVIEQTGVLGAGMGEGQDNLGRSEPNATSGQM